jgi:hypothetical protein
MMNPYVLSAFANNFYLDKDDWPPVEDEEFFVC